MHRLKYHFKRNLKLLFGPLRRKEGIKINESTCPFVGNHSFIPKLNDEQRDLCEGQLTYAECYKVLSTFENNKTPGNDGLTIEILQIGTLLVDSLNYAYFYGE